MNIFSFFNKDGDVDYEEKKKKIRVTNEKEKMEKEISTTHVEAKFKSTQVSKF